MKIDKLKKLLDAWIRVKTWNTPHPLDNKRFHKALSNVFCDIGTAIDGESFEEALSGLVDQYHPDIDRQYKEELIHTFSLRAEYIANYLNDIENA